jgi:predicted RNA-binding protein YlqC (UPF0109 family)
MTEIKDLVEYLTKALVENAEDVEVEESIGATSILIDIHVAREDVGRVIGRQGRHINAMRTLARVLGAKSGKRVSVEVVEGQTEE